MIKLKSWEYWPFELIYFPIFVYWVWLSLKARSLFFFSASNPSIENGGMLGESKIKILDRIASQYKPITFLVRPDTALDTLLDQIKTHQLHFPIIAKPDIGERGWMVEKIETTEALANYLQRVKVDFLIQEYVSLPLEAGVFYYRYPNAAKGNVSSIVIKEMLHVTGDGQSSIRELIMKNDRAKLQIQALESKLSTDYLAQVPTTGQTLELVSIGNHCKGTKFLNGNHLINEELVNAFDALSKSIDGFYYGRYDLRCEDINALATGKVMVMELNGAGSEPAHIYHPGFSLKEAYKVLFKHWRVLFDISKINNTLGVPYMTFKEGLSAYREVRRYNKQKT